MMVSGQNNNAIHVDAIKLMEWGRRWRKMRCGPSSSYIEESYFTYSKVDL